jgi:CsoR family transcriptional regulator, copper-sensing transcriptional repressor
MQAQLTPRPAGGPRATASCRSDAQNPPFVGGLPVLSRRCNGSEGARRIDLIARMLPLTPARGTVPAMGDVMLGVSEQQALVTRLNRIEGQIRGIRRMVQEPRLCIEILQQLAAAEAALNRISLAVFKHHVDSCVTDGVSKGEPERRKQLTELVDIFDRFAK